MARSIYSLGIIVKARWRTLAIIMVIALLGIASIFTYQIASSQLIGSATMRKILSASDFPTGNTSQEFPVQKYNDMIDENIIDAAISVFETEWGNYSIRVGIWMYQFDPARYTARDYYHGQTDYIGNNSDINGAGPWIRVDIDAGDGCTYYFYQYPRQDLGNGGYVPEHTQFTVFLYKGDFAVVMSIDYIPIAIPNHYDQSYIEHIMLMQAFKIELV
jgi:hypothetical protein